MLNIMKCIVSSLTTSSQLFVVVVILMIKLGFGSDVTTKAFRLYLHPTLQHRASSQCSRGLFSGRDQLMLVADVNMTLLPKEVYRYEVPYYYLLSDNWCLRSWKLLCRINLNNPRHDCHPSRAGHECYCTDYQEKTLKLIINMTAKATFDMASFYLSYGPEHDPAMCDLFKLNIRVIDSELPGCRCQVVQ